MATRTRASKTSKGERRSIARSIVKAVARDTPLLTKELRRIDMWNRTHKSPRTFLGASDD